MTQELIWAPGLKICLNCKRSLKLKCCLCWCIDHQVRFYNTLGMSNPFRGMEEPPMPARLIAAVTKDEKADPELFVSLYEQDLEMRVFMRAQLRRQGLSGVDGVEAVETLLPQLDRTDVLRSAAFALMSDLVGEGLKTYDLSRGQFLERSLAAALWTEFLADLNKADTGIAFVLGMLHRIGMVPIAAMLGRVKPEVRIADASVVRQHQTERLEAQMDCLAAASRLLTSWGLPEFIVRAVRHQNHPMLQGGERRYTLLLTLGIALGNAQLRNQVAVAVDKLPESYLDELRMERFRILADRPIVEERYLRSAGTISESLVAG